MPKIFERLDKKKSKDIRILGDFISIFCAENHRQGTKTVCRINDERLQQALTGRGWRLCPDCQKLLSHGIAKLLLCPYDPKPMCKKCKTHCYAPGYREKIREVMKFSGLYSIKHGRLDLIAHYLF
ncbi:MAG: nitrous oxide-stimulated promoter family protein [Chloroflexota bacterium]